MNPATWQDLWSVMPLVILLVTGLYPITVKVFTGNKEPNPLITLFTAIAGLFVAAVFVMANPVQPTAFNDAVVFDGLSCWSNLISFAVAAFALLLAYRNPSTRGGQFSEHVFLVLSAVMGMVVLAWSNDLIVTFIGIELMSLAFYVLAGLSPEQKRSKEASFKYFILGSFGSAIFLYGVALIYGTVGSTSIPDIAAVGQNLFVQDAVFVIGSALLAAGLLMKVSIVPFHAWAPDVYQGSPTPVTAFMATAGKLVAFVVFLRIVATNLFASSAEMINLLQWLAVLTMLVGNIGALKQENFKRMLAYSSLAHSGYALVGLIAVAMGPGGSLGGSGVLFYFIAYSLMNIGAFALVSIFEKNENTSLHVDDLKGLAQSHPWIAVALAICLLSLAGIPPTIGFFGKLYVFSAAIQQGLVWLAVWGVINSVISVYYYLRPVLNMYMYDASGDAESPRKDLFGRVALFASAFLIILMGLLADPVVSRLQASVASLFH